MIRVFHYLFFCFFSVIVILQFTSIEAKAIEENNSPIVSTKVGQIKGNYMKSKNDREFLAFRGIRYAKPPVEELRFRAPQPIEPWTDVFDATQPGPMCPQITRPETDWSEDCLRLSVYTHEVRFKI